MLDPKYWKSTGWIIGCDEVGYGSWAGPMAICAVAVPPDWHMKDLKDSKAYGSRKARKAVYQKLYADKDLLWNLIWKQAWDIDQDGMALAHRNGLRDAIDSCIKLVETNLGGFPERVICDGDLDVGVPGVEYIIKADATIPAVMAASVIAKVLHDDHMIQESIRYPQYDFESNMGYHSVKHEEALRKHGICPIHRKSYKPIKKYMSQTVQV